MADLAARTLVSMKDGDKTALIRSMLEELNTRKTIIVSRTRDLNECAATLRKACDELDVAKAALDVERSARMDAELRARQMQTRFMEIRRRAMIALRDAESRKRARNSDAA